MSDLISQYFATLAQPIPDITPPIRGVIPRELSDGDVMKITDKIFEHAQHKGASDIHLESISPEKAVIRMRIDGNMSSYASLNKEMREGFIGRVKILAGIDITIKNKPQDGKIVFTSATSTKTMNMRVATIPTVDNMEDMVIRVLPPGKPIPLADINMHPRSLNRLLGMLKRNHGFIFVSGPTGSGKTTTLHSIIHHVNRPDIKIWTAEDPIEIVQEGLRQVQINTKIGYDFPLVLRGFLRADPDVIVVGELRDHESFQVAIQASLTGHRVLSTLHTNSVAEAITRFSNMGVSANDLANGLVGGIGQTLLPLLCTRCKRAYNPSNDQVLELLREYCSGLENTDYYRADPKLFVGELYQYFIKTYGHDGKLRMYEPIGCSFCDDGYKGRIAIHELLEVSPQVRRAISAEKESSEIFQIALNEGMLTAKMDAVIKAVEGKIDINRAKLR